MPSCGIEYASGHGADVTPCGKLAVAECADCGVLICRDCSVRCCGASFCEYCHDYHVTHSCLKTQSWKVLYEAALGESDLNRLPERIDDAEAAIAIRVRELFYAVGDEAEEGESLDDAMCILRALRSSLKRRAIQRTSDLKADAA
jgi:hypothetical protein